MPDQLSLNPAWWATPVLVDGRRWLDTTAGALLHPSAHRQDFKLGDTTYTLVGAYQMTTLDGGPGALRLAVEQEPKVILCPPDARVFLALGVE